jgi:hypothetical protein
MRGVELHVWLIRNAEVLKWSRLVRIPDAPGAKTNLEVVNERRYY